MDSCDHQTAPTAPASCSPPCSRADAASAVQGHFLAQLAHGIMLVHAEMEARGVSDHASLLRSYRASGEDFFRSEVYLESERWIRSSADRGYYRAMVHLHSRRLEQAEHVAGLVQSAGRQVHGQVEPVEASEMASQQAANTAEALQWLTRAAEQRADPATMYALAVAHRDGSYGCTTVDVATARHWFKAAAKMGHPPSQFEMETRRARSREMAAAGLSSWRRRLLPGVGICMRGGRGGVRERVRGAAPMDTRSECVAFGAGRSLDGVRIRLRRRLMFCQLLLRLCVPFLCGGRSASAEPGQGSPAAALPLL